jgi:hypothetical protein
MQLTNMKISTRLSLGFAAMMLFIVQPGALSLRRV